MAVSNPTGLGQDGYLRFQKEAEYGTPLVAAMTDLPVKEGSLIKAYPEHIENANLIASRMKQDVHAGRILVADQIVMDAWPTLMGAIMQLFLGTAVSAAVSEADGAYDHYWFIPKTGVRIGNSATIQQALGINLVDQFAGCVIDSITITQDTQGNAEITLMIGGQSYTENVARAATWTFPASSTNPPFHFGHASVSVTPAGGSVITTCANSLTITINLNHQLDRFKICSAASGAEVAQPIYNSIPSIEISMNVDADQYFIEYARTHTKFDLIIDWTHSLSQAGSTPTYHNLAFEFPASILAPDTEIPASNDQTNMDLSFNGSYGGTTTNSAAEVYQGEVRVTDATAAYA